MKAISDFLNELQGLVSAAKNSTNELVNADPREQINEEQLVALNELFAKLSDEDTKTFLVFADTLQSLRPVLEHVVGSYSTSRRVSAAINTLPRLQPKLDQLNALLQRI